MTLDPGTPEHAHALDRLTREVAGWLTSVTPEGEPQTMPVWFLWEDGSLLVYSQDDARRNRNVAANPRVTFHLDGDREGGAIVLIAGDARVDPATPPASDHPAYVAKYGAIIASYGWTNESFSRDYPHPLRITPRRVRVA